MRANVFFFLPVAFLILSCNQLFYHPDSVIYQSPGSLRKIEIRSIWVKSKDCQLHSWHIKSGQKDPFGTVLHFHGNAQNLTAHIWFSYWLTHFGFDLIIFDYSGFGKSTGKPDQIQLANDGQAMISWGLNSEAVTRPLFILGQSLGGRVSVTSLNQLNAQKQLSDNIGGIILDSSFHSYRDLARMKLSEFWLTWPFQIPLSWLVSDQSDPDFMSKEVADLPLLAFHSKHDPVVPLEAGMDLYKQFNHPSKIEILEESGHTLALGFADKKKQIINFLCEQSSDSEYCLKVLDDHVNKISLQ